ncbi:MAG: sensor histidine kinase [Bradymonadia bacterium]
MGASEGRGGLPLKSPWLLALVGGLGALIWGLATLEGILVDERDEAEVQQIARQRALERLAEQRFGGALRRNVESARGAVVRAMEDPLAPTEGLLGFEGGAQVVPPIARSRPGNDTPALDVLSALSARQPIAAEPGPWAHRLMLFSAFADTLQGDTSAAIESAFRAHLTHQANHVLRPDRDLPEQIALLELFQGKGEPDRGLMTALMRTGLTSAKGSEIEGLQRRVIKARPHLTAADFDGLARAVDRLSRASGVPVSDFNARAALVPQVFAVPPEASGLHIDSRGCWGTLGDGMMIVGARVDVGEVLDDTRRALVGQGLLESSDMLTFEGLTLGERVCTSTPPQSPYFALSSITLALSGPQWIAQAERRTQRFQLKTILVVLSSLMGVAIVILAVSLQRRRQRYLALKSDFVSTVSHELKTPLASMRLIAETLERKIGDTPRLGRYPRRLLKDIDGLDFLIENILSFNRLDRGRLEPQIGNVSVGDLVHVLRQDLEGRFPDKTITVSCEGEVGIRLEVDPALMRLLLINLGSNSCQYNTRSAVELALDVEAGEEGVMIHFTDNGVGISPEAQQRIFEAFERGASGASRRGSGLGLAICRQIMKVHRGDIRVSRSGPEGTTFELTLPRRAK